MQILDIVIYKLMWNSGQGELEPTAADVISFDHVAKIKFGTTAFKEQQEAQYETTKTTLQYNFSHLYFY